MNLFLTMKKMASGQIIELISYDLGAREDIPAWCRLTGNTLLERRDEDDICHYYIRKDQ